MPERKNYPEPPIPPEFKTLLQGDFVSNPEKVCAKCGREFNDPTSAKRPHLTRGGTDCDPRNL